MSAQAITEALRKHLEHMERMEAANRSNQTRVVEHDEDGVYISCSECTDEGRCESCEDYFQDVVN